MSRLRFCVLGPVQVLSGGSPLPLGAPKQRALLAFLLLRRGEVVPRQSLVDVVWGADPPRTAVAGLQVYVHGLRRVLGADRIETHGGGYRLRVEPGELDLDRFGRLVEDGRRAFAAGEPETAADDLGSALALWAGPALADLAHEEPLAVEAAALEELRLSALELRNDAELAVGRQEELVAELESLVATHPYRERLREQLILALYRSGRQADALEAYRAARETLVEELGVEPSQALQELERRILRQEPGLLVDRPEPRVVAPLPVAPTKLIGRRLEIAAVSALFRDEGVRLVTLTGTGGTGKTRLALAVADELGRELREGAIFVDLAPVADPELLASTIAEALGVDESELPLDQAIAAHLRSRTPLLLLDNLEQLLPAAGYVADLLAAAPRLLVLATSRAPLRLSGEHEYPVPPLPAPDGSLPFEDLVRTDAVRLFAARARAVDPSFQLTEETARDVAGICRRLDGLPLAIELAAARTRILSPAALATRLDPSLELLVGGPRDVPQRHQTLRATLDWSYELLEAPERRLLARLSVFAGGWTLDAAAAVCADGGDPLELLSVLVDVSLLRRRAGEREQGFAMLETIRHYAVERLVASGEEQLLRRRHAEYFLAVAEQARELFSSGKADEAVYASLDLEHENLRAALRWAGEHGDVELEVRLATALRQFWIVRGYLSEGRRFFAAAVERTAVGDPRLRAEARMHGGAFPYRQGDLATAKAWWQEALELLRDSGDADAIARCAAELGAVAFSEGDLVRATALLQEAGTRFQEVGDRMRFGIVASNLAEVFVMRGELQEALRYAEQGVSNGRAVGDRDGLAVALYGLGRIQKLLGDDVAARQTFGESLVYGRSVGYREVIANCVEAAAEFALADGDAPLAHRLLVVSRAALEEMGVRLQGIEGEAFATTLAALDEQLDAAVRESIEAEAATERVDDVADQALVILQFS